MTRPAALLALLAAGCAAPPASDPRVTRLTDVMEEEGPVAVRRLHGDGAHTANWVRVRGRIARHIHRHSHEIVYVIRGEGELVLGDRVLKVQAGDEVFVPRGTVHAFEATDCAVLSVFAPGFVPGDRIFVETP